MDNQKTETQIEYADCWSLSNEDVAALVSGHGKEFQLNGSDTYIVFNNGEAVVSCDEICVNLRIDSGRACGMIEFDYGEAVMSEEGCFAFLKDVVEALLADCE